MTPTHAIRIPNQPAARNVVLDITLSCECCRYRVRIGGHCNPRLSRPMAASTIRAGWRSDEQLCSDLCRCVRGIPSDGVDGACAGLDRRRRERHVGRGAAGRDRRSVEPGAARKDPVRRHRRQRTVQDREPASRRLRGDLHAARIQLSSVLEQSTNFTYRASGTTLTASLNPTRIGKLAMSYITGSHAFKVGFNLGYQGQDQKVFDSDSPMSFRFNNGVPNQLTLRATPYRTLIDEQDHGAFVQDRWTVNRLTVTGGLRYDYFHVSFPAQSVGPAPFAPTRNFDFPKTDGVTWHDLEPRFGAVYDIFGNGKTALKVAVNKYLPFYGAPNAGGTSTAAAFTQNMN